MSRDLNIKGCFLLPTQLIEIRFRGKGGRDKIHVRRIPLFTAPTHSQLTKVVLFSCINAEKIVVSLSKIIQTHIFPANKPKECSGIKDLNF